MVCRIYGKSDAHTRTLARIHRAWTNLRSELDNRVCAEAPADDTTCTRVYYARGDEVDLEHHPVFAPMTIGRYGATEAQVRARPKQRACMPSQRRMLQELSATVDAVLTRLQYVVDLYYSENKRLVRALKQATDAVRRWEECFEHELHE